MSYSPSGGGLRNSYREESESQSLWWRTEEQVLGGEHVLTGSSELQSLWWSTDEHVLGGE